MQVPANTGTTMYYCLRCKSKRVKAHTAVRQSSWPLRSNRSPEIPKPWHWEPLMRFKHTSCIQTSEMVMLPDENRLDDSVDSFLPDPSCRANPRVPIGCKSPGQRLHCSCRNVNSTQVTLLVHAGSQETTICVGIILIILTYNPSIYVQ